jgi:hypothetical protein
MVVGGRMRPIQRRWLLKPVTIYYARKRGIFKLEREIKRKANIYYAVNIEVFKLKMVGMAGFSGRRRGNFMFKRVLLKVRQA